MSLSHRLACAAILAGVIAVGLLSRSVPLGWYLFDKSLGDVLYATAAYFALKLLFPKMSAWLCAALAFGACVAVELLQLAEINATLLRVPVLRWFLGTTFLWHDIACYLVGVGLAAWLDALAVCRKFR